MTRWKIYGMKRRWSNGGVTSIGNGGPPETPWDIYCSGPPFCRHPKMYRTLREAKAAADRHIRKVHTK